MESFTSEELLTLAIRAEEVMNQLVEQFPVSFQARSLWGGKAFVLSAHSRSLKERLGAYGYHLDGQLKPAHGFYDYEIYPDGKTIERVDIGFHHPELKDALEGMFTSSFLPKHDLGVKRYDMLDRSWPGIFTRASQEEGFYESCRAQQVLGIIFDYAKTCNPVLDIP